MLYVKFRCRIGLERDLKYTIEELHTVEAPDGVESLVVVAHGHEAEALALGRAWLAHHLDTLHGAERSEQLPEEAFARLRAQIVHKQAPTGRKGSAHRCRRRTHRRRRH